MSDLLPLLRARAAQLERLEAAVQQVRVLAWGGNWGPTGFIRGTPYEALHGRIVVPCRVATEWLAPWGAVFACVVQAPAREWVPMVGYVKHPSPVLRMWRADRRGKDAVWGWGEVSGAD